MQQFLNLFLNRQVPLSLLENYVQKSSDILELQDFIGSNLKSFLNWIPSIAIIDAMDTVIKVTEEENSHLI